MTNRNRGAEAGRQQSNDIFRLLFETVADALYLHDLEGRFVEVNQAACESLGYTREELLELPISSIVKVDDPEALGKLWARVLQNGKLTVPCFHRRKDGTTFPVEVRLSPFECAGRPYILASARDITERRQAEEALELSEKKYRSFYQSILEGFVSVNLEGKILEANQAYLAMLGYTAEEIRRQHYQDITPPRWHEFEAAIVEQQVLPRGFSELYEKEYIRKDGTVFPIELRTYLITDRAGKPAGMWAFIRDITERQQAYNALRTSDAFLNSIIDQSPSPMWISDDQGTLIRINRACLDLLHLEEEELVGKYNLFQDNIVAQQGHLPLLRRVFAQGETVRFELRYDSSQLQPLKLKQAVVVVLDATVFPIKDTHGRITHAVIQTIDITKRKQAEEALVKEKAFTEAILDSLPGTFFLLDSQGKHLRTNTSGLAVSGYSFAEMSKMHVLDFFVEEDKPAAQRALEEIFAQGEASLEARLLTKDGRQIPFLFTARRFMMDNMPCILGTGLDITARRQAEKALRESEERYRSLFQNNHSVMFLIDPATGAIRDANPAACEYYGFSREELLAKKTTDLNILTPEQVFQAMEQAKAKKRKQFEFRHRLANGEIRDVEVFSGPIRIRDQELLFSIVHDISARKQAEAALAESEQRFSVFMDHLPAATFIKDETGRVLFANRYLQELFGWQECLGKNTAELLPPQIAERMMADDQRVFREGLMVIPERITDIHGVEHLFDTYKFPISVEGAPTLLGGVAVDVTERKRMEEALEKRLVALSRPLDEAGDIDFNDLFNLDDIQRIQDLFAQITGVASLITAPDGAPLTQPSNFCRLCRDVIRQTELGRQRCAYSDAVLGQYNPDGPIVQHCLSAGLCGAGASVTVGGKHIANWLIGQVRDETVQEEDIRDYARALGVDTDEFLAAFREIPTMPNDHFRRIAQTLFVLANQLSATAYQNVQQARFITERQQAEEALRQEKDFAEDIITTLPGVFYMFDTQGNFIRWNRKLEEVTGYSALELTTRHVTDFFEGAEKEIALNTIQTTAEEGQSSVELMLVTKEGKKIPYFFTGKRTILGGCINILGLGLDITDRKRAEEEQAKLEAQMREVQKLESLGVLAGGIAHDFNNLLMAILGNAELALLTLSPASPACPNLEEITRASQRAADLCRQMLAYSGKGRFLVGRYDLSEIVREMAQMLEVSISKKAMLRYSFAPELPPVEADATQLRQVIMNLITNASEAMMDQSGFISVSTGVMGCDRAYLSESYLDDQLPEGRYVYLEVADNGIGMDQETQRRIFDPFFTTKFTGRGLGLAAVLGIVRGHQGAIKVYSEPGRGTTFKVLLPAGKKLQEEEMPGEAQDAQTLPSGTILLIDDDFEVRKVGALMLERLGYKVLTATRGQEGLEIFRACGGEITCVILDFTMPEMGGEEVFRELQRLRSDVRVILSSGYNEQDVIQQFAGKGLAGFIQKPYRLANLRETLHNLLSSK